MNAVNAVQLFILVWTFSAVCQEDKDISVSCDNVTGTVGKEVNLTCFVSLLINKCSIKKQKFVCNGDTFCRHEFHDDSCEHKKSFTCPYTPNTTTVKCSFFVQASCGWKELCPITVDITDYTEHSNPEKSGASPTAVDLRFKDTVITLVVSGLIIILIIIMAVIYKTNLQKLQNKKLAFI